MGSISEKIELLGKGLYSDIPDVLTITSLPTVSELDYVGSEDFDVTMLDKILPKAVEEKIDFRKLLEIDYQWICRCVRILNYGPYYTTNAIYCEHCNNSSYGEYQVDLQTVECKPLPEGFVNELKISSDKFIDFKGNAVLKLPTIQDVLNAYKDEAFKMADGRQNRELARICYMLKSIGTKKNLNPVEAKFAVQKELSSADYIVLKEEVTQLADYGLRAGGKASCPKCHNANAAFIALPDDRFFRPTVGDLRRWRDDKRSRA